MSARKFPNTASRAVSSAAPSTSLPPALKRKSIASLLRLTHRLYSQALLASIAEHGITTIVQWWTLRSLWLEDGLTQRELSERVGIYESAIVGVIDSLVEKGLLLRVRNRDDRRKINVYLTKPGRNLEKRLLPLADEVNRNAEAGIDSQARAALWDMLSALYINLDTQAPRPAAAIKAVKKQPIQKNKQLPP